MTEEIKLTTGRIPNYLTGIGHPGGGQILADLSLNENHLGPSPRAVRAFNDVSSQLWQYPDGSHLRLREAIASRFGVEADQIACGAGADELIALLMRLFVTPGEEVVFPEFSFIMFSLNALRIGALPVAARTEGFAPSVESLLECITDRTRAVFLASPNNPTGACLMRDELGRLVSQIPAHIPLILDCAYAEYVDAPAYSDGLDLSDKFPNLVVLRSFSKIFGLASLRIGWCYASREIVDALNTLRGPYNISGPAQSAAIAALEDAAHTKKSFDHNREWRYRLTSELARLGLRVEPGGGNFLMIALPGPEPATRAYNHLRARGLLIRQLQDYRLPNCLRITIGTSGANELLLRSLEEFVSLERQVNPIRAEAGTSIQDCLSEANHAAS